jgi:subtilisin family serine protease
MTRRFLVFDPSVLVQPEGKRGVRSPRLRTSNVQHRGRPPAETAYLTERQAEDRRQAGKLLAPAMRMRLIKPCVIKPLAKKRRVAAPTELWGLRKIGALSTRWTGKGAVVAILDTGINAKHEAFKDIRIIQKDFTGTGLKDTDGHGTHCAGTIFGGAVGSRRIGVAPGIDHALVAKVIGPDGATTDSLMEAMQWAALKGAHVISMSLGMDFPGYAKELQDEGMPAEVATSEALHAYLANVRLFDAIQAALANRAFLNSLGVVIVAAAGNESRRDESAQWRIGVGPPAASKDVISVAAVSDGEPVRVASFSNSGAHLAAPGVGILSADPRGGLAVMDGTSMAAPHVAGIAALWVEKMLAEDLPLNSDQLRAQIMGSCKSITKGNPVDVGAGLIQAPR